MDIIKKISPFILTVLIGLIFFSTSTSYIISDSESMLNLSVSIYELGNISSAIRVNMMTGETIFEYSKYGIGLSVFLTPFLFINDILHSVFSNVNSNTVLALPNLLISALLAQALYLITTSMGYCHRKGLAVSLLAIFSTFIYPYINIIYSEPLQALLITCAFLFLLKALRTDERRGAYIFMMIAGAFLGYGVLTKAAIVTLVPIYYAYLLLGVIRRKRLEEKGSLSLIPALVSFTSILAVFAIVIIKLNQYRFGSIFEFGYEGEARMFVNPLFHGIFNLLVNPNKGLILFAPLTIIVPYAIWRFSKVYKLEATVIAALFLINMVIYAKWWAWEGAESWGPRFLLPLVPLMFVPLAEIMKRRALIIIIAILAVAGFTVNLLGVVVDITGYDYVVLTSTRGIKHKSDRPKRDFITYNGIKQIPPYVISSEISKFSAPLGHLWIVRSRHEGLKGEYGFGRENARFKNPPWKKDYPYLPIPEIRNYPFEVAIRLKCPPPLILRAIICPERKPTTPIYHNALMNQAAKAELMGLKERAMEIKIKAKRESYEMEKRRSQMRHHLY